MFRSKKRTSNVVTQSQVSRQSVDDIEIESHQVEDGDLNGDDSREEGSDDEVPSNTIWKDIADIKDKDVEIIDGENKISRRKGIVTPAQVWTLEKGLKFVVKFDKLIQPIEKGRHILIRFLGDIAKKGSLSPIGEINWHHVQESYKTEIVKIVRDKFHMPKALVIDEGVLSKVGRKWRSHKYTLRKHHFDPAKTEVENSNKVPNGVVKEQWIRLVHYWCSPQGKKLSNLQKRARVEKDDCHTTGSKSYAQKRNDFVEKHKRNPSNLEFWKETHQRKDGSYVVNTSTEEFMETAQDLVDKSMAESFEKSRMVLENEVFNELMYDKDIPNQRLVGYGHGVCRSQVFGWKANLRK